MPEPIEWAEQTLPVGDLKPYERNPRRITKEAYERLVDSLKTMGYHQRIIAQPDGRVIGGHQRIQALKQLGYKTVKVLVPSRELTYDEFRQLLIQDNLPFGDFDFDALANDFDREELISFGMPEGWLEKFGGKMLGEQEKSEEKPQKVCPHCGGVL
jgi:ParB-like chromosome segregation protein Spo0J